MTSQERPDPEEARDLFDGFKGYYRASRLERLQALKEGLIVLDTNALLDLYRFSPSARAELFEVMRLVHARLFVPHQVALEFHRNRVDAVAGRTQEFDEQRARLTEVRHRAVALVRQLAWRSSGRNADAEGVEHAINSAFDEAAQLLESVADAYDLEPDTLAMAESDPIATEANRVLQGCVAAPPDAATRAADLEEAARRIDGKIPPGFGDRSKGTGEGAEGDYLWWAELKRRAAADEPAHVVVVSNDVRKGDNVYEKRGLRVGPSPELVAELESCSGARLHWLTVSEFLTEVGEAVGAPAVSAATVREAESVETQDPVEAIRLLVSQSPRPVASSAAANAALGADPTLKDTSWRGTGSFRLFLSDHLPEYHFVIPPQPGYVMDPEIHDPADIPRRSTRTSPPRSVPKVQVAKNQLDAVRQAAQLSRDAEEAVRRAAELPPELVEAVRQAAELSPETLEAIRRLRGD